jgi:hypothetical protein
MIPNPAEDEENIPLHIAITIRAIRPAPDDSFDSDF